MSRFQFQRHQRLLGPADFKGVFDHVDQRASHNAFLVLARVTEATQPGRLGLVVAKKHLKRAVDRNSFKRTVRNRFRLLQHQLQGLDLVVLARKGSQDCTSEALDAALEKNLLKLADRCRKQREMAASG